MPLILLLNLQGTWRVFSCGFKHKLREGVAAGITNTDLHGVVSVEEERFQSPKVKVANIYALY